mmetsp:Transcript_12559/g.18842  ORF Transcript_12559/g.18842 Transcript_12559/m.18842 type:complete len:221 (-) Transcript_12559:392-1054(-)|eukprot:CAMPEP_0196800920 /NCGR_PEP_ID=MMETSP1362-20130617/509_1 /TAXON_ID=163516 /ORGANISM="Leptocylindrus danicus, Strain CCMP1856" /LENGTH=220 /DNA_ID=CAMNT_0042171545 /DNA_START=63 /DNA_END=725 /DNA_ORIENTATION=+
MAEEANYEDFMAPADDAPIILGEAPPVADYENYQQDFTYDPPPAVPGAEDNTMFVESNEPILVEEVPEETAPVESYDNVPIVLMPVEAEAPVEEEVGGELTTSVSAMAAFNVEFQETLKLRKEAENAAKAAAIAAAEEDLATIAAQRSTKREAKMSKNRSEEQSKLEAMEADLENDNSWQRVVKLVDLTQDGKDGAQDTKRMRDVFIVLKNDENKAAMLV